MENTIRVAKYLRVSTADQAEQYSLHAQNRILTSYIEANKDLWWETSESLNYIDDWITWASKADDRPALSRLKKDILDKKIDVILIYRLDRLFRKVEFLLNFITFLRENSINLISKSENIDINTHSGNLMITMLWAIWELERSTIQERTMDWKISKAMQWYFVNWMVPFWYSKESDWKGNKLIVNKEEAEIVKKIYKMYLEDWWTIMWIRQFINSLWIWTRYDKSGKEKLTKNFIHYSFINKILRNEVYTGIYPFNKGKTGCRNWIKEKEWIDKTKWLYLECPQIIDKKTFDRVQEKIGKWKAMNGRWEKHVFTWLLTCW
jgi:site-specific DNA recombinase